MRRLVVLYIDVFYQTGPDQELADEAGGSVDHYTGVAIKVRIDIFELSLWLMCLLGVLQLKR
jgi:hypothetical protein